MLDYLFHLYIKRLLFRFLQIILISIAGILSFLTNLF